MINPFYNLNFKPKILKLSLIIANRCSFPYQYWSLSSLLSSQSFWSCSHKTCQPGLLRTKWCVMSSDRPSINGRNVSPSLFTSVTSVISLRMAGSQTFSNVKSAGLSFTRFASIWNCANPNASTSFQNHKTLNSITSGDSAHTTQVLTVQSVRPYVLVSSLTYVCGAAEPDIAFVMGTILNAILGKWETSFLSRPKSSAKKSDSQ